MSAKRQATSDLNHDNWDKDEEPEKRGLFQTASEDELKNRVIKKARRKISDTVSSDATEVGSGSANKSVFSGFAGFGKVTSTTSGSAASSPFSFLTKNPSGIATSSNNTATSTTSNKPAFTFGGTATKDSTPTDVDKSELKSATSIANETSKATTTNTYEKSTVYYAKLKDLNQSVSDWIKTHVDKNPLCILTPIYKDYENHLEEIEKEKEQTSTITSTAIVTATTVSAAPSISGTSSTNTFTNFKFSASPSTAVTGTSFSFGISSPAKTESTTTSSTATGSIFGNTSKSTSTDAPKTNGFSFGLKSDEKKSPPASSTGFSFGKPYKSPSIDDSDKKSGFSFASSVTAPFTFGNIQPPASVPTSTAKTEDEDEDQPPKVEFKQVVEDGAVFCKKCKVFVKKDGNFADRGVGTLYLKPIKDSEKTQLLVRADTNLGNILVNLILNAAIPTQRMGKNNVMLVCHPTPDFDKPTPLLLRVKTGDEADELLETINKYKK